MKSLNDDDKEAFQALAEAADALKDELSSIMSRIADARRTFARNPSDEAGRNLEKVEEEGAVANGRLHDIVERMAILLELSEDEIQSIESAGKTGDALPRYRRDELTVDQVASDGHVDTLLARSYDSLL
ncbi:hypothetical protein ACS0Y3_32910, partial [Burkholderia gladioli]|uniref:hypothetical protein n=1 Tax=Burkholderia gladioli TaxID=28095 RepID=UPI003F7A9EB9